MALEDGMDTVSAEAWAVKGLSWTWVTGLLVGSIEDIM